MQNDASKEGSDANTAIIRLPTKEQTKLSHGKINGQRSKQRFQRGEEIPKNTPVVGLMKPNEASAGLQNQLHAADRQRLEGVQRRKDSKQLLMVTMKSFRRKGDQERPQLPGGGRSSPASPPPTTYASSDT
jgi:hypothetical protein